MSSVLLFGGAAAESAMTAQAPQAEAIESAVSCEEAPPPGGVISLDTKGVEFGPWIRRFVSEVRQQWRVPPEYSTAVGCAVVSFRVHRDGTISDIAFKNPSSTPVLSETSRRALVDASPVGRLPAEYREEFIAVTSTFFYNMSPPQGAPGVGISKP